MDPVFKALADPTRRLLLDRLREHNGQTLRELCERLAMARQSATQHLDILVRANLVTVVRRGRERLHYLNPVPIHEIEERWISGFDKPRLQAISAIKNQAEEYAMTNDPPACRPTSTSPTSARAREQVWQALTDADLTARYWGHANVSDWQPGSSWEHRRVDGSGNVDVVGRVLEAEPPTRLVITFEDAPRRRHAGAVGRHLPRRAAPGHRPPHRDPREPPQPGDARRHLGGLAGRAGQPQVAARDRRGPSAGAVGDVRART